MFITNVVGTEKFVGFDVLIDFLIENVNKILTEVFDAETLIVYTYDTLSVNAINDDQVDKVSDTSCEIHDGTNNFHKSLPEQITNSIKLEIELFNNFIFLNSCI